MAIPPPDPNFTGAQKTAYAQQYGGYWDGSQYKTGTAPAAAPATTTPAPIAAQPAAGGAGPPRIVGGGSFSATATTGGGPNAGAIGTTTNTPNQNLPAGSQTIQSQFRNALLGQLNTDPNNISLNDPSLKPQMQAYTNSQQRSQERGQQDLAELGFAGGTGRTGAYAGELGNMESRRGEAEAQFGAGLIGQEKQQRLQSLFQALGLGSEQLTADESLRLQRELGLGDLNLRGQLGQGQLSLGLLQALLGNEQFNNNLGANLGMFGATLNQNATLPFIK